MKFDIPQLAASCDVRAFFTFLWVVADGVVESERFPTDHRNYDNGCAREGRVLGSSSSDRPGSVGWQGPRVEEREIPAEKPPRTPLEIAIVYTPR